MLKSEVRRSYSPRRVLLHVEDSDWDHEAFKRALKRANADTDVHWCRDSTETLDYLSRTGTSSSLLSQTLPRPSLIFLDINLPGDSGQALLQQLKNSTVFSIIPVIILSSSANPRDVEVCYRLGANAYLVKTLNPKDLEPIMAAFSQFWLSYNLLPPSGSAASTLLTVPRPTKGGEL